MPDDTPERTGVESGLLRLVARLPADLAHEVVAVYRRVHQVRVIGLSAEVAFFTALALVPLLSGVIAVVARLDLWLAAADGSLAGQVQANIESAIRLTFTGDARAGLTDIVGSLFEARDAALSISLVFTLFFASRGFSAAIRGLTIMYGTHRDRPWWHDRLAAVGFAAIFIVIAGFALAAFIVGPFLGRGLDVADSLGIGTAAVAAWGVLRWVVLVAGLVSGLAALYHFARRGHGRWVRDLPGAVIATAGLALAIVLYRVTLSAAPGLGFTGSAAAVGAVLGGFLATMVLLAITAGIILVGGAINAEHDGDAPDVEELEPVRPDAGR